MLDGKGRVMIIFEHVSKIYSNGVKGLDQVDLSIIPCVSCDRLGHRLGQGTGFYDRFFAGNPENAAMLCRESLLRTIIPREPHDVVFPLVITEFGVYRKGVLDLGRRSPAFRVWA